jgi:hypothetical protein
MKLARSNERAHLNRDELEAGPRRGPCAREGAGFWRGSPHQETEALQGPRRTGPALYKVRWTKPLRGSGVLA